MFKTFEPQPNFTAEDLYEMCQKVNKLKEAGKTFEETEKALGKTEEKTKKSISCEDQSKIDCLYRKISFLKNNGDDYYNIKERRECYAKIRAIKDSYLSPEQIRHKEDLKSASEDRTYAKRQKISDAKMKKEKSALATITPKQKAINEVVTCNYIIRMGHNDRSCNIVKKYSKKKMELIKKWGIKSTDLRRQKKFDPKYA
jgi:predicted transcriptional regulator